MTYLGKTTRQLETNEVIVTWCLALLLIFFFCAIFAHGFDKQCAVWNAEESAHQASLVAE